MKKILFLMLVLFAVVVGCDGEDGQRGAMGITGPSPIKGVDYDDGAKGDKGDKGGQGDTGPSPIKGVDYFDGDTGKNGNNGNNGRDGRDGDFLLAANEHVDKQRTGATFICAFPYHNHDEGGACVDDSGCTPYERWDAAADGGNGECVPNP